VIEISSGQRSPSEKITPIEATYLLWVDVSAYNQDDAAFCEDLRKKTGLWITPGSTYGKGGEGYVRINLATSLSRVKDGMGRLLSYIKSLD
jgi:cystathionine beta-lyase